MAIINGCLEYDTAIVEIHFQKDHADCAHCYLLETYARKQCRRTGEYIVDDRTRGIWCPLKFTSEEGEVKDG